MFKKAITAVLAVAVFVAAGLGTIPAKAAQEIETSSVPAASLSITSTETAGLLYMYEEEKLARDVYTNLAALWGQPIFRNIAASEQTHMDAVRTLLVRYGIAVPQTSAGTFNDPALQSLYTTLMSAGSRSLGDALKTGATIEEVDIRDLQTRLNATGQADIRLVYTNLMNGSYNHLRSFSTTLKRLTGETYQPQYLDPQFYAGILAGTAAGGNGQAGSPAGFPGGRHGRP
jgi:hypothetical protein